jgi:hypothetical protein
MAPYTSTTVLLAALTHFTTTLAANCNKNPFSDACWGDFSSEMYSACYPYTTSNVPDESAPCNAGSAVYAQCIYGALDPDNGSLRSNTSQQTCMCDEGYFSL